MAIERLLLEALMSALGRPPLDVQLWDGRSAWRSERATIARLRFADRRTLWRFLARPELGFADAYVAGTLQLEGDLPSLLASMFRPAQAPRARPSQADHRGPRSHEFHRAWLDERMVNTCAYFEHEQVGLEQAQLAKLDRVCRKLGLRPGQRVIDASCGWGALALHAAEHYGVYVQAFNGAREPIEWAREQARARSLGQRIEFIEDDYRGARGQFDAFVAVGMLEQVGREHLRKLGEVIDRCLAPTGRGLLHFVDDMGPGARIPGAGVPSLAEMLAVLEPFAMAVLDVENLRRHHEQTLNHWLRRFDAAEPQLGTMLDDRQLRGFRLYLARSIAAFRAGTCQLYQVAFARAGNSALPWTRRQIFPRTDERGLGWTAATS